MLHGWMWGNELGRKEAVLFWKIREKKKKKRDKRYEHLATRDEKEKKP